METEKRKRQDDDDGEMHRKRMKGGEVNGQQTVSEDEVEEFFAILRRIQVAVKYFEKGNGERGKLTEERWRPRFEAEDFEDVNNVIDDDNNNNGNNSRKDGGDEKAVEEEAVEQISGFDLNSDPAS